MTIKELKERIKDIDNDVKVAVEMNGNMGVANVGYVIHGDTENPEFYFVLSHIDKKGE